MYMCFCRLIGPSIRNRRVEIHGGKVFSMKKPDSGKLPGKEFPMKTISRTAVIASVSLILIVAGAVCGFARNKPLRELDAKIEKVKSPEKRKAIAHIRDLFQAYDRHYMAMNVVDYIIAADRNVPVLAKLAEYAITEGSHTGTYVDIARYAGEATLAEKEFLRLAEIVKKRNGGASLVGLARQAARAKTEADLQPIRDRITALEKK